MIDMYTKNSVVVVNKKKKKINDNELLELALGHSVNDMEIKTILNNYEGIKSSDEILKYYGDNN